MTYEPHLLQPQAYHDLLERLDQLSPSSQALWGKMNVSQMLAHAAMALEMAFTDKKVSQSLIGRLFGPFGKREILTTGIPKNSPTVPSIRISDQRVFGREEERLQRGLERFFNGGETGITAQPHEFWGRLTSNEWARLQYVHVDHHLKQFGV
jgi:Protein of unknown function (DUF1569)